VRHQIFIDYLGGREVSSTDRNRWYHRVLSSKREVDDNMVQKDETSLKSTENLGGSQTYSASNDPINIAHHLLGYEAILVVLSAPTGLELG
jgi:hypothetical protein